jgi:expansin (peptidoglycan-binding protein)
VEKTTSSTHSEEPKTTQAPPPPPETTTQKPTSTTTSKEVKTTSKSDDNNNSGNGGYVPAQGSQSFLFGKQTGDATFYDTGLTACGKSFSNSDYIVAVSQLLFDTFPGAGANPNLNPICGKRIRASMPGGGSVEVTVQDRCTGCSLTSLDFTPDAFNHLGDQSQGRLHGMTWEWIP